MKRQIKLYSRTIEYNLRMDKRTKHLRLSISCDGTFSVSAPRRLSLESIESFIIQKSSWVVEKMDYFKSLGIKVVKKEDSRAEYLKHKERALALVRQKIEKYNGSYGFSFQRISIRNQKTRWGSCSRGGNLNFNYKLALIPERLAEYVVVHELCHLKEFNHSPRFWNLVAQTIPDYMERRRALRDAGLGY